MRETKIYCDLCGDEIKVPTVISLLWPGLFGDESKTTFEICDKCREEVKNLVPEHLKTIGGMRATAVGCIKALIMKKS